MRLTREALAEFYHRATGNGPSRSREVLWCAETLEVDRRTISRKLAGETTLTERELVRLRVAARAAEIRRSRASESGWLSPLRAWWTARAAERAIAEAAIESLMTRVIANRELDRHGGSERDQLPGGRFPRRRGSDYLTPGGATRFRRGGV